MVVKFKLFVFLIVYPAFSVLASPIKFYSINSKFGISIRETNSICKDNNGFIWASSKTGILRLTNNDYRVYPLQYETTDIINVKLVYKFPKLVAYTNNGQIFSYDPVFDRFDLELNLGKVLKDKYVRMFDLIIDGSGVYWIALYSGLYKYQNGKLTLIENISPIKYLMKWYDNERFIIVKPQGISLFDTRTCKSKDIYSNYDNASIPVSAVFLDKINNMLWVGTFSKGLFCYDFKTKTFSNILKSIMPKQPIRAIEANTDSTFLIGVDGQGVWELNKSGDKVLNVYKESDNDPNSLRGNGVYDIFCDNDKHVWICTYSGGVSFFEQKYPLVNQIVHHISDFNSLVNSEVNNIIEDKNGNIWFATNNGLSCWNVSTNQWKSFYSNRMEQTQVFLALCEDDMGRIWAGTYSSGVYILDEKTGRELAHYSKNEKGSQSVSNFIFSIFKDNEGNIWMGSVNDELICYISKEDKFKIYPKEPINAILEISPYQILLGCTYGLSVLDKQTSNIKTLLLGFLVQDMIKIGDEIWICTSGEGLIKYNLKNGKTEKFTTQKGLPSNFVNGLIYVDNYIWLGTENGLCRFNIKDYTILNYSSVMPLSGSSFNRRSRVRLKNGQLIWGTNNGAVVFAPNSIVENQTKGKIYFQDISILGRSIRDIQSLNLNTPVDSLQSIVLKYSQNTINLELLSIGILTGAKFSWKLEGFDKNWTPPANNSIITYTNIPSGKFNLRVKLYNSSLSQVLSERAIAIKIVPPFWRTNWFLMVIFILILTIIWAYRRYTIQRILQKSQIEKERYEIKKLEELDKMKSEFFSNISHEFRTPLSLIINPLVNLVKEEDISSKNKNKINLILKSGNRLLKLTNELMDFSKIEKKLLVPEFQLYEIVEFVEDICQLFNNMADSMNIDFKINNSLGQLEMPIDKGMIEKVIFNLLSNAFKYTPVEGVILINISKANDDEKEFVKLSVINTGKGIDKDNLLKIFDRYFQVNNVQNKNIEGTGIGLSLVKSFVELHNGKLEVKSEPDLETCFDIYLPIIQKEYKGTDEPSKFLPNKVFEASNYNMEENNIIKPSSHYQLLIVEDDEDIRNYIMDEFSSEFKILSAKDGQEGLDIANEMIPDLIITDVIMPVFTGIELCQKLKNQMITSHIPILILSAKTNIDQQIEGLEMGADVYMVKPFSIVHLKAQVLRLISFKQAIYSRYLKETTLIPSDSLSNKLDEEFMKKVMTFIEENITNSNLSVDQLANCVSLSKVQTYRKVKAISGLSAVEFIRTVRLKKAAQLILEGNLNFSEIAFETGFSTPSYFSKCFHDHFGKTPSDFATEYGKT